MNFNKHNHTYDKDGKPYRSVSEVVASYMPEFPKELIASKVAAKQGVPAEEILQKWDDNAKVSTTYGNAIDRAVRYWIDHGDLPNPVILQRAVESFAEITKGEKLHANVGFSHDDLLIAGTTDIIKAYGKKKIDIRDVKTNGDLYKSHKKMLTPFNDLEDSPLNKYRLQLSLYGLLAEYEGLTVGKLEIWHWTDQWEVIKVEPLDLSKIV